LRARDRTPAVSAADSIGLFVGDAAGRLLDWAGTITWVLAQGLVQRDPDHSVTGFVGTITDITGAPERDAALRRSREWLEGVRMREQLQLLTHRLALAEEGERRRIANHLHDRIGHSLALAKIKLGMLHRAGEAGGNVPLTGEILGLLDEAIRETRSLTFELASPVLHELGLEPAIEDLCDRLARESGIRFRCETETQSRPLAREQRILLYRVIRELLRNIVKHAQACSAWVRVHRTGSEVRILVEDDGVGFDVAALTGPSDVASGFGLFSVREGLKAVGGRVEVDSAPARGTRVALVAPLQEGGG
jgi:signal transduction histidine kinase